ncbi:uncharacterized protein LOC122650353 [Telopea speciosissima]|uniref:uncharacterized protein LOC122650353 n=1 Tax=Telopea speciosissima TaxID=54955 RepID=UPI001CC5E7B9|nr:uncharacterized protein LOC122650353 [Telopea speciosissima]
MEKMQSSSPLSSASTSFSPLHLLPNSRRLEALPVSYCRRPLASQSRALLRLNCSRFYRHTLNALQSTVIEEVVETSTNESEFVEIGYIAAAHGLQGELRVQPSTDFPELRFTQPGKRWLRERILGREMSREVELVDGRSHPGQKSWIVSLSGIDTVDKAKQLVGSTFLVREHDRPVLEDGEFYTPDLVGMAVIHKDTGKPVGTIADVFKSGVNDLLRVRLNSSEEVLDRTGSSISEKDASGPFVWIPFVEAIVPDVDMTRREMHITPPKGLLELNLRSDYRSKKERRQLEWKQRKKFQQRLIAAKKKLCEMKQQHIFHGFRCGEKAQRSLLADQIVGVNSHLLQQAMLNTGIPSERWDFSKFICSNATKLSKNPLKIPKDGFTCSEHTGKLDRNHQLQQRGIDLMLKGKVAIILVVDANDNYAIGLDTNLCHSESVKESSNALLLQSLLDDERRFLKIDKECVSLPLMMVSPTHDVQPFQKLFSDYDYFFLDKEKVWFFEEAKLPVVISSPEEQNEYMVLMKSPWEILQSPVGSGGVFSLLSSNNIIEILTEMGVEYVQVSSLVQNSVVGYPLFFGLVDSREADIGVKINKMDDSDQHFDMIFSMKFLKNISKQIDKLQYYTIAKQNAYVEKVDKEWVDVVPASPNSYEIHCSIYSSLNACPSDKICVMELTD